MPHTNHGFTLIELLIVVAIIGILAAIAVPNFINAQIRAKVARTMSDIRSISTALEMYNTDKGDYPEGRATWARFGLDKLTSPVAYMASVPPDPFAPTDPNASAVPAGYGWFPEVLPFYVYLWARDINDSLNPAISRDYLFRKGIMKDPTASPPQIFHFYQIRAMGPNGQGDYSLAYDASNGLLSPGDISYHGPGAGF
ncbi:MAG: prepilin-type N-terminal cleavage/methylation domain-containing protein [Candidatus Omnitrophota bacterium]|jgi:type II secretion system protein G|nr:MAG: prepilin-type N-terminal cleavage/methylation domain-containing protein [Candidatus Omnitrophota bacterium]